MDVEGLAITNLRQFEYENMVDIHTLPNTQRPMSRVVYMCTYDGYLLLLLGCSCSLFNAREAFLRAGIVLEWKAM